VEQDTRSSRPHGTIDAADLSDLRKYSFISAAESAHAPAWENGHAHLSHDRIGFDAVQTGPGRRSIRIAKTDALDDQREKREAIVLFPDAPRNKPAPLVFVFHGHGSTMEAFVRRMPIQQFWPEAEANDDSSVSAAPGLGNCAAITYRKSRLSRSESRYLSSPSVLPLIGFNFFSC